MLPLMQVLKHKRITSSIVGGVGTETLSPQSNMYLASSTIPVSATAKQGYSFDYWHDPQGILFDTTLAETEANISKIDVMEK